MNHDEDYLCEITNIIAGHAATVLARLLDCTLLLEPPECRRIPEDAGPLDLLAVEECGAVVYADLAGVCPGQAALVLPADVIAVLVERLMGKKPQDEELDDRQRSALCEMGNIAISAAANALGDLEGGVVIPSLPRLDLCAETAPALTGRAGKEPTHVVYAEIYEREGGVQIRFLWVPAAIH